MKAQAKKLNGKKIVDTLRKQRNRREGLKKAIQEHERNLRLSTPRGETKELWAANCLIVAMLRLTEKGLTWADLRAVMQELRHEKEPPLSHRLAFPYAYAAVGSCHAYSKEKRS